MESVLIWVGVLSVGITFSVLHPTIISKIEMVVNIFKINFNGILLSIFRINFCIYYGVFEKSFEQIRVQIIGK